MQWSAELIPDLLGLVLSQTQKQLVGSNEMKIIKQTLFAIATVTLLGPSTSFAKGWETDDYGFLIDSPVATSTRSTQSSVQRWRWNSRSRLFRPSTQTLNGNTAGQYPAAISTTCPESQSPTAGHIGAANGGSVNWIAARNPMIR